MTETTSRGIAFLGSTSRRAQLTIYMASLHSLPAAQTTIKRSHHALIQLPLLHFYASRSLFASTQQNKSSIDPPTALNPLQHQPNFILLSSTSSTLPTSSSTTDNLLSPQVQVPPPPSSPPSPSPSTPAATAASAAAISTPSSSVRSAVQS